MSFVLTTNKGDYTLFGREQLGPKFPPCAEAHGDIPYLWSSDSMTLLDRSILYGVDTQRDGRR